MQFKQLATGTPPDIEAIMSLQQAEAFKKDLQACEGESSVSFDNVQQAIEEQNPTAIFIIPGDDAGDSSDLLPELEEFLEVLNNKILDGLEDE